MDRTYIEEKTFENIDFTEKPLARADYESCSFHKCNFSNADLSLITFSECDFNGCNLSSVKLGKTGFRQVRFQDSKLLGLHFEHCDEFLFSVGFVHCTLDLSSFYRLRLAGTKFRNCSLQEVDFTETDLSQAEFDHCDLRGSIFEQTILVKADLRTAYNYSIDPELNRIKKAKFSMSGIHGLLQKYDIQIEF